MLKIEQNFMVKDGKTIGYVKATLVCKTGEKEYAFPLKFDDKTRKRFNKYARSLGYTIGVTDNVCSDSSADPPSVSTDDDLPL